MVPAPGGVILEHEDVARGGRRDCCADGGSGSVPGRPAPWTPGRWTGWCDRALGTRRPEDVRALLARLRAAQADGAPQDRAAALDALTRAPAPLLLLLDRHARPNPPPPGRTPPSARWTCCGCCCDSLDARGRTREEAVAGLAACGGPLPAAALAVRAADWVPEVRVRAGAALLTRTAPDEVAAAVRVLLGLGAPQQGAGAARARTARC